LQFPELAIPLQRLNIRPFGENKHEVWDIWRKKWIQLSPEEWVRQQFLHWLVAEHNYPAGRILVEKEVPGLARKRRFDALVLSKSGSVFMILEFKAPEVELSNEVFLQIAHYNSQISAHYLAVSNGLQTCIAQIKPESNEIVFLTNIPSEL
jgi:hypothetical protein